MRISVSEAKGQLTELVRRAETGDEVVLTRHGKATVRLVPVQPQPNAARSRCGDRRRAGGCREQTDRRSQRGPQSGLSLRR